MNELKTDRLQFVSEKELKDFQVEALRKNLSYCFSNSSFYNKRFTENKLNPGVFSSLEELRAYPFTTKEDLQNNPDDFRCVKRNQLVDYASTSGTLGQPVFIPSTSKDLDRLALNECISFMNAGLSQDDVIQLMTTIDKRFMAGLAYFLGARKLEAGIIRVGSGLPELQWDNILNLNPTAIIVVPSFIVKLLQYAEKHGIDPNQTSVKRAVCIGESFRNNDFSLNSLGKRITENWDISLHGTYASTEMSAAFTECEHGVGGHLIPEITYIEVLDEHNQPVTSGQSGEVVFTSIGVEALPLVRYRTGDICSAYHDMCKCGRTTMRLGPVIGRKQQMIKLKGTTLYPPALFNVLNAIPQIENYVVEISDSDLDTDHVVIRVVCSQPSDQMAAEITERLRSKLRVKPELVFATASELATIQSPEKNRKLIKFIDHRATNNL